MIQKVGEAQRDGKNRILRKGLFVILFEAQECWEEFKAAQWPEGNEADGKKRTERYGQEVEAYEKAEGKELVARLRQRGTEPALGQLSIQLPKEMMVELSRRSEEFGVQPAILAQIWIVERLRSGSA
ncbi:MAG: hypothetical protein Q8O86_00215 [Dehalococcoidia bacterium]|nr:hypothetical protein [Dehalococcoidia bacterium]